jgi:predicted nucleic acid-binding protein
MTDAGATPLIVDTTPLYARFDPNDQHHARANTVFDGIREGRLAYRPLYVPSYVLGEFVALGMQNLGPATTIDRLGAIRESAAFTVLYPDADEFDAACRTLERYDDQEITLVDHLTGILARQHDVEYVLTFDGDFRTLGFTVVSEDTGKA